MPFGLSNGAIAGVEEMTASLWRAWTAELAACVPPALRGVAGFRKSELVLRPCDGGVALAFFEWGGDRMLSCGGPVLLAGEADPESAFRSAAGELAPRGVASLAVALAATDVLHRKLSLPVAPDRYLRGMVENEIARVSPLPAAETAFAWCKDEAGAIDVFLTRKAAIEKAEALARLYGVEPDRIDILDGKTLAGVDFLRRRSAQARRQVWMLAAACLMVGVLAAANGWLHLHRLEARLADMDRAISEIRPEASEAEALSAAVSSAEASLARLDAIAGGRTAAASLADLSSLIGDDSWLSEFQWTPESVRIVGISKRPSALVPELEKAEWVKSAAFRGPSQRRRDGKGQTFDIAVVEQ